MSARHEGSGIRRGLRETLWLCGRTLRKGLVSAVPISVHFKIAGCRGRISAFRGRQEHVRQNLQHALGEVLESSEIERIAWDHHRFTQAAYLSRLLPNLRRFEERRRWPIEGIEYLDQALAKGRGVILITAHYGYPHLIPRILGVHGYKAREVIADLDRSEKQRNTQSWLANTDKVKRYVYQHTHVLTDLLDPEDIVASLDVRPILKALAKNEILLIAGDGLRATEFRRFQLLGKEYPFPTGFMKIALLTNATVLPTFAVPDEIASTVRTEIKEPLPIDPKLSVQENLQAFVDVFDEQLRRAPHFWQRWRRANYFEEALKWADDDQKDPFTTKSVWMRDSGRSGLARGKNNRRP